MYVNKCESAPLWLSLFGTTEEGVNLLSLTKSLMVKKKKKEWRETALTRKRVGYAYTA